VYNIENQATSAAVGLVYGTKQFSACVNGKCTLEGNGGYYELNSLVFDVGICVLPGLHPGQLQAGDIIDQQLIIVPRVNFDDQLVPNLLAAVDEVAPPVLYRNSDKNMSPDLLEIVNNLREYDTSTTPGVRTSHMATLLA